jgi:MraZ protein
LDPQKRVSFPSEWRPSEPKVLYTLVLWPHVAAERKFGYINGLTQRRFQELLAKLERSGLGDQRAGALRRAIFGNSTTLPLDVAGRLVLPSRMAEAIGLQREVLFVGVGADFQIWDPDLYEKCTTAEAALAADAYTQLV